MCFTLLYGLEHMFHVVPAVRASGLPFLCLLNDQRTILGCHHLLALCPILALDPCWVVLAPLLVYHETLRAYEQVSLIVVAAVDTLASAVPTAADVELKLAEVGHLVVGVEWTQEHVKGCLLHV